MTMNDTWGFKSYDENWKSTETLVRQLVDAASKGGNYLLNVGPTKEGIIPEASVTRLKEMGEWMKVNGEAIYGTSASPFAGLEWGRSTTKGNKIYLSVFDWPKGTLEVPLPEQEITKAYLLADPGKELELKKGESSLAISVPAKAPDAIASVIVLEQ